MTLHCNLVKLWSCPQWVAEVCMHEISKKVEITSPQAGEMYERVFAYMWALQRYLKWAEDEACPNRWFNETHHEYKMDLNSKLAAHKAEILAVMSSPDLRVWIE